MTRALMVDADYVSGGPAQDVMLGPVLLARWLDADVEIVRIYRPEPTAAFSRRDAMQAGFARATETARDLGFTPVVRPQGGRLAAYHRGSVVIDHISRQPKPHLDLKGRFERYAALHARVLSGLGVDARIGELPGEYCPGEHSVNAAGVCKIVGSAQRVTRDGWLFSSVIQVTDAPPIREMLTRVHQNLGYELNPLTVGAIEDYLPEVTVRDVGAAMRAEYAVALDAGSAPPLPADILDEVVSVSATASLPGR